MNKVIIHYDEINLKKKNRSFFEKKLLKNLKDLTPLTRVKKEFGYLIGEFEEDPTDYLTMIPGIYSFAIAEELEPEVNILREAALKLAQGRESKNFAISTKRRNKKFPLNSMEINEEVGGYVHESTGIPVKLKKPDLEITIEITENMAYIYADRHYGIGGLPVGGAASSLCLLSGGIDSPVAAYMMMKRGTKVHYVHFLNATDVSSAVKDKIIDLARQLAKFQGHSRLYMVPFQDLQWEIIGKVEDRFRMLVYRRFMLKIANRIADEREINALITGDSLSQVASQTLENLRTVYEASNLPILHPLIGFNKLETIRLAEKINTFDISSRPYDDCCTFYVPKHPATKAKLGTISFQEKDLDDDVLIKLALDKMEVISIKPQLEFKTD